MSTLEFAQVEHTALIKPTLLGLVAGIQYRGVDLEVESFMIYILRFGGTDLGKDARCQESPKNNSNI